MAETQSMEPLERAVQSARSGCVAVVYASRAGSTRGVAERIAERIGETGRMVELHAAAALDELTPFDAVVLGSAVYHGRWLPAAEQLARRNRGSLAGRRVWLFSVGSLPDTRRLVGAFVRGRPRAVAELCAAIAPRDYRVFAGVIGGQGRPWLRRALVRALGGRRGDNRDWGEIDAWAQQIARALRTQ